MKWVNPPVAYMLHAGVAAAAGGRRAPAGPARGRRRRVALEAYPGLLARELIGSAATRATSAARQTPDAPVARTDIVDALEQGRTRLGLRLQLTHAQRETLLDDAGGDALDAVLCLVQAAWASTAAALRPAGARGPAGRLDRQRVEASRALPRLRSRQRRSRAVVDGADAALPRRAGRAPPQRKMNA